MDSLYCRIYGRVQLVMYRDFAKRKADRFGIKGFVRNLPDGSVEAFGAGKREDLERWLRKLRRGPLLAHVDRVDESWAASPPRDMQRAPFDSFSIVF